MRDKYEAIIEFHPELREVLNKAFERCKTGKISYVVVAYLPKWCKIDILARDNKIHTLYIWGSICKMPHNMCIFHRIFYLDD